MIDKIVHICKRIIWGLIISPITIVLLLLVLLLLILLIPIVFILPDDIAIKVGVFLSWVDEYIEHLKVSFKKFKEENNL